MWNTTWQDFESYVTHRLNDFNGDHLLDIIAIYRQALADKSSLDFENLIEIDEETHNFWTGVNHVQFNMILDETPSLRESSNTPKTDLAAFLCKIRTGEPGVRLDQCLGCHDEILKGKYASLENA